MVMNFGFECASLVGSVELGEGRPTSEWCVLMSGNEHHQTRRGGGVVGSLTEGWSGREKERGNRWR
ncbi:hypothetical protein COLO4_32199 [Corchorus olitorius]|uniref:Uncharacterized protein n=1 Tax=Corchorus olitorius TaxID=93759 RepID=A0A1R3H0F0_9ROSI|nr:hypothetical protein COLO4_32199 [Corchorus olitorius]